MGASIEHMGENKLVADVAVVGGGVIGFSIALEMQARGAQVVVVERGEAMRQASHAAAGMLAVNDPGNPPELLSLSQRSVALYPAFLRRVEALSGAAVPFQTSAALQYGEDHSVTRFAEWSLDPRQLGAALLAAVQTAGIWLMEGFVLAAVEDLHGALRLVSAAGPAMVASQVVYASGAWALPASGLEGRLTPRKGQMLRVRIPEGLTLDEVNRSEAVYIVPRRFGPQAGTALIGATVEDVGFDVSVRAEDLARLRALAAELVPELGDANTAPMVEAWAGLRPATPDGLPTLGAVGANQFIAGGHYRNGILLAPATAMVVADLLTGTPLDIDLGAFSPGRFPR